MHLSMLSRRGGGGEGGGRAWGGDLTFFNNLLSAFKFPAHGQIIPFNCNQVSQPRAAHFCPSQGWTQERHNKNMSN